MATTSNTSAAELASRASIALITALPIEEVTMKAMLDNPISCSTTGKAPGEYHLGTIPSKDGGEHVVVLARCSMGENLASANVAILLERFPQVQDVVMVGIAGAVPDVNSSEADVRLGDVVVIDSHGVIQFDHDKETLQGQQVISSPRHPPRPPSARLLAAANDLRVRELEGERPWEVWLTRGLGLKWTERPQEIDVLYEVDGKTPVTRQSRQGNHSRIFHGKIASGNKLLKNPLLRERLRLTFGVKAMEMEGSGVADASWLQRTAYFVVRGACDYCDAAKSDAWQGYAALVAAAYTRALLGQTRAMGAQTPFQSKSESWIDRLPRRLREDLKENLSELHGAEELLSGLDRILASDASATLPFDSNVWPNEGGWTLSVLDALDDSLRAWNEVKLSGEELLVCIAVVPFVSHIRKAWTQDQLTWESNETPTAWLRDLIATDSTLALLDGELPRKTEELIRSTAILRSVFQERRTWSDEVIRKFTPEIPLAQALAQQTYTPCLVRAVGGSLTDFEALRDDGSLRIGRDSFNVRWRLLACILSLAELRVIGLHSLSPGIVEYAARLPNVANTIEAQFRDVVISSSEGGGWLVRATCDEPVLDNAIEQIAEDLSLELRAHRAPMSDYMIRWAGRGFPAVSADVSPRLTNGRPRYTKPHVKFSLSAEHAQRLFMGSNLWGDPSLAYRELFQNALDACRYRAARCKYLGITYVPLIRMHQGVLEGGVEYVECEDNGIGMDRALLANCFAKAGSRFVDTTEFRRERAKWRERHLEPNLNSQFGIGVFSYFTIADQLEVETARLGPIGETPSDRLLLQIPTNSSFFRIVSMTSDEALRGMLERVLKHGNACSGVLDAGTRVRLLLKPRGKTDENFDEATSTCIDAIRAHVWLSEVRTEVHDHRGESLVLEPNQLASWLEGGVSGGEEEPRIWWFPRSGHPLDTVQGNPISSYRSQHENSTVLAPYHSMGRVLVDGIATDATTPGFVVNLRGPLTPQISLDRRKVQSDIREMLEAAVARSVAALPTEVFELFLKDLWLWDPRVCHRVNETLRPTWTSFRFTSPLLEGGLQRHDRTFLPRLPEHDEFMSGRHEGRKTLVELWKLANDMPEARQMAPFVLESRYVPSGLRRNLRLIPDAIWQALANLRLGVPEAAAFHYGLTRSDPLLVAAYMSWLTGESLARSRLRAEQLSEFLGEGWPPAGAHSDAIVSDHDAWLLGCGSFKPPWVGPKILTMDVLRLCQRTGWSTHDAEREYRNLTETLGWSLEFDAELADSIGVLTEDEYQKLDMWRRGFAPDDDDMDIERLKLLARLAGRALPAPRKVLKLDGAGLTEEERVMAGDLYGKFVTEASLAQLCQVVRRKPEEFSSGMSIALSAMKKLGMTASWSQVQLEATLSLRDDDWLALESSNPFGTAYLYPKDRRRLAATLATNRYAFSKYDAAALHVRLSELYAVFAWGAVPLTKVEVEAALKLSYEQGQLLERHATSGKWSIASAIVACLELARPLPMIASDLKLLVEFGLCGPQDSDLYLGVAWRDILASCSC